MVVVSHAGYYYATISSNLRHSRTTDLRSTEMQLYLVTASCSITVARPRYKVVSRNAKRPDVPSWRKLSAPTGRQVNRSQSAVENCRETGYTGLLCRSESPRHVAAFRGVSVFPPGGNDDEWRGGSGAKRRACGSHPENVASRTERWFHLLWLISRDPFAFAMIARVYLTLQGTSRPYYCVRIAILHERIITKLHVHINIFKKDNMSSASNQKFWLPFDCQEHLLPRNIMQTEIIKL